MKNLDIEAIRELAKKPIDWQGDLNDDCTAIWAGLILRAEWMDDNDWWWAVSENVPNGHGYEIDSSNNSHYEPDGESARKKAELVARKYVDDTLKYSK